MWHMATLHMYFLITVSTKRKYTHVSKPSTQKPGGLEKKHQLNGFRGTPPTFHLAPSVLSTRLLKNVYFLLGETVDCVLLKKSDRSPVKLQVINSSCQDCGLGCLHYTCICIRTFINDNWSGFR